MTNEATINFSKDGGPTQVLSFCRAHVTAGEINAALADAGVSAHVVALTPEKARARRLAWEAEHTPEKERQRKLDAIRAACDADLAKAIDYMIGVVGIPRARRRAIARHPLRAVMHGGLLPRELDDVYAYLTDYPDDY